jgi:hypothetical protein
MRTLELATEQLQWLKEDSLGRVPAQRKRGQRCFGSVPPRPPRNVLFVGAERQDEFADALRLSCQGHNVIVVNPKVTPAAKRFIANGGKFVRTRIEELPPACGCFNIICENYPYPSGQHYVPPRAFGLARLSRLAPGGPEEAMRTIIRHWSIITGREMKARRVTSS